MRNRLLSLILVLCLVCPAALSAARIPTGSVYTLYLDSTLLGPAVLFLDASLLLSTAVIPQDTSTVTAVNGDSHIAATLIGVSEDNRLSLFSLETPASGVPCDLDDTLNFDGNPYWGLDADGKAHTGNIARASYADPDMGTLSLTCEDSLLPGTLIFSRTGNLSGMVYASLGEGEGRYLAMTAYAIYQLFYEDDETAQADPDAWYTSVSASLEENCAHLTWQSEEGSQETGKSFVYFMDVNNDFYNYISLTEGETSLDLVLVPGRSYAVWIGKTETDSPDLLSIQPELIQVPMDGPATEYDFTNEVLGVSILPASQKVGDTDDLPLEETLTRERLLDTTQNIYWQVTNRYAVEEEIETSLVCAMTMPDGSCAYVVSGYLYSPDYMERDTWHMDITSLFRMPDGSAIDMPAGAYTLTYYLGCREAGTISFTLP